MLIHILYDLYERNRAAMKFAHTVREMPNAFQPKALSIEELEEFYYDGTMPVRTGDRYTSPIEDIFLQCQEPSATQNTFLLLGHKGCGKSTELNEMSSRLNKLGYPVHTVQCAHEMNLNGALYSDLLILMGDALLSIAKETGCRISGSLERKILLFWAEGEETKTFLKEFDAEAEAGVNGASLNPLKFVFDLFATLKAGVKYSEESRREYKKRFDIKLGDWMRILNDLADQITEHLEEKQPVIIFEDLDKLGQGDSTWRIFSERATVLNGFSFPVIYTFPIALSYDPRFGPLYGYYSVQFFPMIKVEELAGGECLAGFETIRSIIRKRCDETLFDRGVEDYLIRKTGGSLRNLFNAISAAAARARRRRAETVSMEDAKLALQVLKSELSRLFDRSSVDLLIDIHEGNKKKIDDTETLLNMLLAGTVLEYNGVRWQNLHPLISEYLEENYQQEIEEYRKKKNGNG